MLGTLLESVLFQLVFELRQSLVDIFELLTVRLDFAVQAVVFPLEFLVLVSLLWVEVVQAGFVSVVNLLDLLLVAGQFVLHVFFLSKQRVQMVLLFVVLVLDVHVQVVDIFWLSVATVLVQCQVVVGQLALILADVFDQHFVAPFESEVLGIVAVDIVDLLLHFLDFVRDLTVLLLHQVEVIVAVVNLTRWSKTAGLHATHAVIRDGSVD